MARFGVGDVVAPPGYPPDDLPDLGVHLIHVRLDGG
jgi:hypothetical protein